MNFFSSSVQGNDEAPKYQVLKLTTHENTNVPDALSIKIRNEDDTLGNMVRQQLLQNDTVTFAGYRKPHPLLNEIVVNVRSNKNVFESIDETLSDLLVQIEELEAAIDAQI
jgi:DNA-directed RNA polymerase II subunit RPB11